MSASLVNGNIIGEPSPDGLIAAGSAQTRETNGHNPARRIHPPRTPALHLDARLPLFGFSLIVFSRSDCFLDLLKRVGDAS
ncbi:hypothetical protein BOX30_01750 [Leptospirillum ferriphilum]|jgi:hypothetical protein|nr:hypothetical protein BOX30_01750 [Leptospirillum ferriphilum]